MVDRRNFSGCFLYDLQAPVRAGVSVKGLEACKWPLTVFKSNVHARDTGMLLHYVLRKMRYSTLELKAM
jgi:hypothetical protein